MQAFTERTNTGGVLSLPKGVLKVQTGTRIKFWMDLWIGERPLADAFPDLFNISTTKKATVADCWNSSENDWDLGFRRGLFDWEVDSWMNLIHIIDVVRIGEGEDRVSWSIGKRGSFSTRSARLKMVECIPSLKSPLISTIWNFKAPKKIKVFLWSLAHRALILMICFRKSVGNG